MQRTVARSRGRPWPCRREHSRDQARSILRLITPQVFVPDAVMNSSARPDFDCLPMPLPPSCLRLLRGFVLLVALGFLTGCDQLGELLELPNPARDSARKEAEGHAIGSACRHAGRALEDCYILNPKAEKAAIFAGWRDMNDYMMEHQLEVVPARLQPGAPAPDAAAGTSPAHLPID